MSKKEEFMKFIKDMGGIMRLKNKKTGEIGYFCFANWNSPVLIIMDKNGVQLAKYNSLAELNEEWEDYEELKEHWYINCTGEVLENNKSYCNTVTPEKLQSIGNYFETKEEAEKAVERLRAWKRLKEDGFTILGYEDTDRGTTGDLTIYVNIPECNLDDRKQDFDLLFGGEE